MLHLAKDGPARDPTTGYALLRRLVREHPESPYRMEAELILGLNARVDGLETEIEKLESQLEALKRIDLERSRTAALPDRPGVDSETGPRANGEFFPHSLVYPSTRETIAKHSQGAAVSAAPKALGSGPRHRTRLGRGRPDAAASRRPSGPFARTGTRVAN